MPYANLTAGFVDKLPLQKQGEPYIIYRDKRLEGFCVRVTSGAKSYIIQKSVNGRQIKYTLGRFGQLKHEDARRMAGDVINDMAKGINPTAKRKAARAKSITLQDALKRFLEVRSKLKPRTVADYNYHMKSSFSDWAGLPIRQITKDMVAKKHKVLTKDHGPAQADQAFRYLRAIMNFVIGESEDSSNGAVIVVNPVRVLSRMKVWNKVDRKRSYIKNSDLPAFHLALEALREELAESKRTTNTVPDYLELILLTGLRRNEAARLEWAGVNLKDKMFTVMDTKNNEPLTLPMSDRVFEILFRRYEARGESGFVFPDKNKAGHLTEPRRQMKKIINSSGVKFTIHDLRRTFATVAESLDISGYALKRLLNHKQAGDVTAGYIVHDVERLRTPMQAITDAILTRAGRKSGAEVIPINRKVTGK